MNVLREERQDILDKSDHVEFDMAVLLEDLRGWTIYKIEHYSKMEQPGGGEHLNRSPNPELNYRELFLVHDEAWNFPIVIGISSGTVVKLVCGSLAGILFRGYVTLTG